MSNNNFTRDSKSVAYDRNRSRAEYQQMSNNSGLHNIGVILSTFEDWKKFTEYDEYLALYPEEAEFWRQYYKDNSQVYHLYNNSPGYEEWWYSQPQESVQGGAGTDVIKADINKAAVTYNLENESAASRISSVNTSDTVGYGKKAYDHKFYNLGEGRIGIESPTSTGIEEITDVETLVFLDQRLSPSEDILPVFEQVKGIDDTSGAVFRLYSAAFNRLPDSDGLRNWINANTSGSFSLSETASEFVESEEFVSVFGDNQTDQDYTTAIYNNVLERDPDADGLAHYLGLLEEGKSRGDLLIDFAESPENRVLFSEVTGLS